MTIHKFFMAAKINNQKGFATIEIIFVLLIISILAGNYIPKISRSLDIAQLNYETKKFLGEYNFVKAVNKNSSCNTSIFSEAQSYNGGKGATFMVSPKNASYHVELNRKILHDTNYLPKGFKITLRNLPQALTFDSNGRNTKSGAYIFESAQNISWYVKKNSVGRLHINRVDK